MNAKIVNFRNIYMSMDNKTIKENLKDKHYNFHAGQHMCINAACIEIP